MVNDSGTEAAALVILGVVGRRRPPRPDSNRTLFRHRMRRDVPFDLTIPSPAEECLATCVNAAADAPAVRFGESSWPSQPPGLDGRASRSERFMSLPLALRGNGSLLSVRASGSL